MMEPDSVYLGNNPEITLDCSMNAAITELIDPQPSVNWVPARWEVYSYLHSSYWIIRSG